jgi:hypothetical protein
MRPTSGVFVSTAGASSRLENLVTSTWWKGRLFVAGRRVFPLSSKSTAPRRSIQNGGDREL